MCKKITLLGLAVTAVAMFALPAAASAQEIHWTNTEKFTGTGGAGTLVVTEEPTITFEDVHIEGTPAAGGTTGTIHFDFTGCHVVLGFTFKCHSLNSALSNTVTTKGTYHLVTLPGNKPGMLVTLEPTTITAEAGGLTKPTIVTGSLLGTITSPACGGESKSMTISFSATGSTQNHLEYTALKYDLLAETEETGQKKTAGFTMTGTISQATAGKLECT